MHTAEIKRCVFAQKCMIMENKINSENICGGAPDTAPHDSTCRKNQNVLIPQKNAIYL